MGCKCILKLMLIKSLVVLVILYKFYIVMFSSDPNSDLLEDLLEIDNSSNPGVDYLFEKSSFLSTNKSFEVKIETDSNIDVEKYYTFSCRVYKTLKLELDKYYNESRDFNFTVLNDKIK